MASRHSVNSAMRGRIVVTMMRAAAGITGRGGDFEAVCAACGILANRTLGADDPNRCEVGHIVSDAHGGDFALWNLLPLCRACNLAIGDSDILDILVPLYRIGNVPLVGVETVAAVREAGAARMAKAMVERSQAWKRP